MSIGFCETEGIGGNRDNDGEDPENESDRGFASTRRARCLLHPRAPCHTRRPHGRVEIRVVVNDRQPFS